MRSLTVPIVVAEIIPPGIAGALCLLTIKREQSAVAASTKVSGMANVMMHVASVVAAGRDDR
jgi:hypothetical protein